MQVQWPQVDCETVQSPNTRYLLYCCCATWLGTTRARAGWCFLTRGTQSVWEFFALQSHQCHWHLLWVRRSQPRFWNGYKKPSYQPQIFLSEKHHATQKGRFSASCELYLHHSSLMKYFFLAVSSILTHCYYVFYIHSSYSSLLAVLLLPLF